jgi:twinkle protein
MISQYTVDKVKESAKIADVIRDFFDLKNNGSQLEMPCPYHPEKTPSFKINVKENFAKCFGCGKSVDCLQFVMDQKDCDYPTAVQYLASKYKISVEIDNSNVPKKFARPAWKNKTTISDKVIKWFENERKISQSTLSKARVTDDVVWMPESKYYKDAERTKLVTIPSGERQVVCFNYFRNDELINIKYRDSTKSMRLVKDAELIFYNLDSLKDAKKIYILEGEIEVLTFMECGLDLPGTAILSVPNGANIKSNNLAYLDSAVDLIDPEAQIILGTDNDIAGRKLREDLAERFGKERCVYIEWKDKKDSNDVLKKYGIQGVIECVTELKEFPIEGAYTISSFSDDIDDLYINGLDKSFGIGIDEFDKQATFAKGYLTIITGVPSHGKSSFLDQVCLLLNLKHGWKFAMYSPENRPTKLHISKMARMLIGKPWFGHQRMSEQEKNLVKAHLEGKIWFVKPPKGFTMQSILDKVKELKVRHGITAFTIDSWNKLEHKYKASETQYISEQLDLLTNFCEDNKLHCFLVAHPTKMEKDKKDPMNYVIPNLYSISGSAAFFSKADIGMCVWRNYRTNKVRVLIQKVRENHWGELGHTEWEYDKTSGRFNVVHAGDVIQKDENNWITNERRQAVMEIPEQPGIITGSYEPGDEPPF